MMSGFRFCVSHVVFLILILELKSKVSNGETRQFSEAVDFFENPDGSCTYTLTVPPCRCDCEEQIKRHNIALLSRLQTLERLFQDYFGEHRDPNSAFLPQFPDEYDIEQYLSVIEEEQRLRNHSSVPLPFVINHAEGDNGQSTVGEDQLQFDGLNEQYKAHQEQNQDSIHSQEYSIMPPRELNRNVESHESHHHQNTESTSHVYRTTSPIAFSQNADQPSRNKQNTNSIRHQSGSEKSQESIGSTDEPVIFPGEDTTDSYHDEFKTSLPTAPVEIFPVTQRLIPAKRRKPNRANSKKKKRQRASSRTQQKIKTQPPDRRTEESLVTKETLPSFDEGETDQITVQPNNHIHSLTTQTPFNVWTDWGGFSNTQDADDAGTAPENGQRPSSNQENNQNSDNIHSQPDDGDIVPSRRQKGQNNVANGGGSNRQIGGNGREHTLNRNKGPNSVERPSPSNRHAMEDTTLSVTQAYLNERQGNNNHTRTQPKGRNPSQLSVYRGSNRGPGNEDQLSSHVTASPTVFPLRPPSHNDVGFYPSDFEQEKGEQSEYMFDETLLWGGQRNQGEGHDFNAVRGNSRETINTLEESKLSSQGISFAKRNKTSGQRRFFAQMEKEIDTNDIQRANIDMGTIEMDMVDPRPQKQLSGFRQTQENIKFTILDLLPGSQGSSRRKRPPRPRQSGPTGQGPNLENPTAGHVPGPAVRNRGPTGQTRGYSDQQYSFDPSQLPVQDTQDLLEGDQSNNDQSSNGYIEATTEVSEFHRNRYPPGYVQGMELAAGYSGKMMRPRWKKLEQHLYLTHKISNIKREKQEPIHREETCYTDGCLCIKDKGFKQSGVYNVPNIEGSDKRGRLVDVYCEMEQDGGGWTVIQRRVNGTANFYRGWEDYAHGFGYNHLGFWIGNRMLHAMTKRMAYELRVDFTDWNDNIGYAKYRTFSVGSEDSNFYLRVSGYDAGNRGDSLSYHHQTPFSTYDRDNDMSPGNCAAVRQAGFWFKNCNHANPNGRWVPFGDAEGLNGAVVTWGSWIDLKYSHSLKTFKMMIRPVI